MQLQLHRYCLNRICQELQRYKLLLVNHGDVMYSTMTIVNNIVLYI